MVRVTLNAAQAVRLQALQTRRATYVEMIDALDDQIDAELRSILEGEGHKLNGQRWRVSVDEKRGEVALEEVADGQEPAATPD